MPTVTVAAPALPLTLTVTLLDNVRLRTAPSDEAGVLALALAGDTLTALGRSNDGSWLLVDAGFDVASWLAYLPDSMTLDGAVGDLPLSEEAGE